MPRKTKYNNVLGKDFASQKDAYNYFQILRDKFVKNHLTGYEKGFFTEDTPISLSAMYKLLYDYGDEEYLKRKDITKPYEKSIKHFWFATVYKGYPGYALHYEKFMQHKRETCETCAKHFICIEYQKELYELKQTCSTPKVFTCFPGGQESSTKTKVSNAFRNAVREQSLSFRSTKNAICEKCGAKAERLDGEVDHKYDSFKKLIEKFISEKEYEVEYLSSVIKEELATADGFHVFTDPQLKEEWAQFHKQHASLQLLCTECHKEKTRKERSNG